MAQTKKLHPIPPGEILRDALDEAGLTANAAALRMRIPNNRLSQILHGERAITPDTALRLARLFGTSAQMWMNLQSRYDLEVAEDQTAERIEREVETPEASASVGVPKLVQLLLQEREKLDKAIEALNAAGPRRRRPPLASPRGSEKKPRPSATAASWPMAAKRCGENRRK